MFHILQFGHVLGLSFQNYVVPVKVKNKIQKWTYSTVVAMQRSRQQFLRRQCLSDKDSHTQTQQMEGCTKETNKEEMW